MSVRSAGDYVIWRTYALAIPGPLMGYKLSARQSFLIRDTEMIDSMSITMNDRFVAWNETPAEPTEAGLFGFDLAKRESFLITREFVDSTSLRIGGNTIVMLYMNSQGLYGFDGVTRQLFQMAAGNVDMWTMTVNERYAIWRDTWACASPDLIWRPVG